MASSPEVKVRKQRAREEEDHPHDHLVNDETYRITRKMGPPSGKTYRGVIKYNPMEYELQLRCRV